MSAFGWSYPAGCTGTPYDDDGGPEACPVCGGANWDPETEKPVFCDAPEFCSAQCLAQYMAETSRWSQAHAAELAAEYSIVAALEAW